MRSLEAGDIDAAFDDVLTMWRMGHQVRNGGTLVEQLVGIAIQGIATSPIETICASGKPTSKQLMDFLAELDKIPQPKGIHASVELAERYMMLDIIVSMGRGETDTYSQLGGMPQRRPGQLMNFAFKTVDWEECLRVSNIWYERIIEDAKIEGFEARSVALTQLEDDMKVLQQKLVSPSNLALTAVGGRRVKGRLMAESLVTMLSPALQQVSAAEFRSDAFRKRSRILIALTAFGKDNGHFPQKLEELAPKYLMTIPDDPFTNLPFKFELDKDEFGNPIVVLYSVGVNQIDDVGADFSSNGDDWPVQWYVPTWEDFQAEKVHSANAWFDEDEDLEASDIESETSDFGFGSDNLSEVNDDLPPKPREK
jgi:CRISPR/Cas system CSM-associated protein Csm2 small subunit